tara:strand:+ start:237 stop:443 length:207 start_codon:yes stop_codon:yes gene_type:complete
MKKETNTTTKQTVFEKAQTLTLPQAVQILSETANIAQKNGLLTVDDSVLVARAIELVSQGLTPTLKKS